MDLAGVLVALIAAVYLLAVVLERMKAADKEQQIKPILWNLRKGVRNGSTRQKQNRR